MWIPSLPPFYTLPPSVFYKANFVDPRELTGREDGGVAVLSGTKASRVTALCAHWPALCVPRPLCQVVALNPTEKKLTFSDGTEVGYDKCLLATGGRPKNLSVFATEEPELQKRISLYRAVRNKESVVIRECGVNLRFRCR